MSRMTRSIARSRPATKRALTIVVAVFSLLAQATSFAHLLLVRHEVCLEHGELIHASEADGEHLLRVPRDRGTQYAIVEAGVTAEVRHAHDHCDALSERRKSPFYLPPRLSGALPPAASVLMMGGAEAPPRLYGAALLLLAPKNSPPV
jgi:hypothetical protein